MTNSLIVILFFGLSLSVSAQIIKVQDDAGNEINIERAAKRVVALSPHIVELLYAVGGENNIIAAVDYSNYPDAAKKLPRVGSGFKLDIEAIVGLKPDLIIAWKSGNNQMQLETIKKLGFKLYLSEPKNLQGIAKNLRDIGELIGHKKTGEDKSRFFINELNKLTNNKHHLNRPRVFYQVWEQPLFTVNGQHMISQIIELCGGENVFKELSVLSPQVDIESVISRNPDVIVVGVSNASKDWLKNWNKWASINAVKNNQLYGIDADLIVRHTPRILQGVHLMCEHIEKVRSLKN